MSRVLFLSYSLMPQGVEHDSLVYYCAFARRLLIIDAVRRYFGSLHSLPSSEWSGFCLNTEQCLEDTLITKSIHLPFFKFHATI
jgi:hypothetical protein